MAFLSGSVFANSSQFIKNQNLLTAGDNAAARESLAKKQEAEKVKQEQQKKQKALDAQNREV